MQKCKISVFVIFDRESALIDPKINSAHLWPLPYYGTNYELLSLFYGRDMRETDRQTYVTLTVTFMTLTFIKGHVTLIMCCAFFMGILLYHYYFSI